MREPKDMRNKVFHDWTVLDDYYRVGKFGCIKWKCKCKCGTIKYVFITSLQHGKSKRCFKCGKEQSLKTRNPILLTNAKFGNIQRSAKKRNIEFNITKEYIWDLFLKQNGECAYTGIKLIFQKSILSESESTASLDRINSKLGYIEGNVQWVHKMINWTKSSTSHDDFIKICHLISQRFPRPSDLNLPNYRLKTNRKEKIKNLCECGNKKLKLSERCQNCHRGNFLNEISTSEILKEIKNFGYKSTARKYKTNPRKLKTRLLYEGFTHEELRQNMRFKGPKNN